MTPYGRSGHHMPCVPFAPSPFQSDIKGRRYAPPPSGGFAATQVPPGKCYRIGADHLADLEFANSEAALVRTSLTAAVTLRYIAPAMA